MSRLFPRWMPIVSAMFRRGNDGLTKPERRYLARRYRNTVTAPLKPAARAALDEWRHKQAFRARYDAAYLIEPWGERMDALLALMHEDPALFAEVAREAA